MAEMLILAREPWNNDIDTSTMDAEELEAFNSRFRKGDVIVVRPDGWKWGKEECIPKFLVVKNEEKYEDAQIYEHPFVSGDTILERKYYIPTTEVDKQIEVVKDFIDILPISLSDGVSIMEKV